MRRTMAQALIEFLKAQYVERDGHTQPFFAGCWGIFGHGNVGGVAVALQEQPDFRYYQARNEQAMVHSAIGFAKISHRLRAMACLSSIGPGATNMVSGAATATINRLPVLLLTGDIFATRRVAPVLQQLEAAWTQDISVSDAFKPVSKYWDRINRPEQLGAALLEAMRVLTSPAETGAVTLALPQDVQAEAYDYPDALLRERVWHVPRLRPDLAALRRVTERVHASRRPLLIAGGGVLYSEASEALAHLVEATGIPVGETKAGKGALPFDHPQVLGAMGSSGNLAANRAARDADLVVGVGTRFTDFTTASATAFQNPAVRLVSINIAELDAGKHAAEPLQADARAALEELRVALSGYRVTDAYRAQVAEWKAAWEDEVDRRYALDGSAPLSQAQVIGVVNAFARPQDVVVCAAGSLPGDLHKLWRTRRPGGFHLEFGYSCMGYEIAGGLGAKLASPERDIYVLVGDASYLMMAQEIVTALQEGIKLTIVVLDNHGWGSIGGLSEEAGTGGWGTAFRSRNPRTGALDGDVLPVDLARNAESLGARAIQAATAPELRDALAQARTTDRTTVVTVEVDGGRRVPAYDAWWDVPVAEVSSISAVREARRRYEQAQTRQRHFL
ncbi:MAG: 3D-(3,5/4)-trihydroxycyclohexane-1,2-dione acylhydrolase (decyclizing) [Actinobacteria bacterium]|nr:3D-(3,5/4)-trihydroxycyclohexane-1,2-dione acylhydrolase (decyclizing) [Actinomycetota bacterium]